MKKINAGIVGYGNLGKALEEILLSDKNFNLVKIFSRRENLTSKYGTGFDRTVNLEKYKNDIDDLFLCVGSFNDIEKIGIKAIENFNTVDSFDTHKKLKDYIFSLDTKGKLFKKVALSAFGWDPGLMSLIRVLFDSISEDEGVSNSFWGTGVSQGHSDALRRVNGVKNAIQYTVPNREIILKCKRQFKYTPSDYEKHKRICFVAENLDENKDKIETEIINMPNYFSGYETEVNFVEENKIEKMQKKLSHKGYIVDNFKILNQYTSTLEFSLKLASNPHFTARMMSVGGKIVNKLFEEEKFGAYSILDIPIKYFSDLKRDDLLSKKL